MQYNQIKKKDKFDHIVKHFSLKLIVCFQVLRKEVQHRFYVHVPPSYKDCDAKEKYIPRTY